MLSGFFLPKDYLVYVAKRFMMLFSSSGGMLLALEKPGVGKNINRRTCRISY